MLGYSWLVSAEDSKSISIEFVKSSDGGKLFLTKTC